MFLSTVASQYFVGSRSPSGHIKSVSSPRFAAPLTGAVRTRTRAKRERSLSFVPSRQVMAEPLVDQGTADQFLEIQLKPELLERSCARVGVPLTLRMQGGYDHSYFFISTFIEDHLRWHAKRLGVASAP